MGGLMCHSLIWWFASWNSTVSYMMPKVLTETRYRKTQTCLDSAIFLTLECYPYLYVFFQNNDDLDLFVVDHNVYGKGFIKTCKVRKGILLKFWRLQTEAKPSWTMWVRHCLLMTTLNASFENEINRAWIGSHPHLMHLTSEPAITMSGEIQEKLVWHEVQKDK